MHSNLLININNTEEMETIARNSYHNFRIKKSEKTNITQFSKDLPPKP